jgi:peptidoglycan/xylan/chitin deacetylase (PgdA/CDA1 family)
MTEMVFRFSNKPFILTDNIAMKNKFPGGELGGMILSADFELAWAWRYAKKYQNSYATSMQKAQQARRNFPSLIESFDQYSIPVTWATVGHLFLQKCTANDHQWMDRIPYFENRVWRYDKGDWYDNDPCTYWQDAKEWYAPDLVEEIQNAKVEHEISTHTFSHIDFSDKNCPPQVADDEMKASFEAAQRFNIKFRSIVFPGGTWGNVPILKKYGIQIYRKNTKVDLAYPYFDDEGLLVTPTSAGFTRNHFNWTAEYYVHRFKTYIDKAIQTNTVAHFWFHPSVDDWTLKNVIPIVLEYASQKRGQGELWVGTMSEIADIILKNKQCQLPKV